MKRLICLSLILFAFAAACPAASVSDGFRTVPVDRYVCDFNPDTIKLDTPLDYYLSRAWVRLSGKARHWHDISTSKFAFDPEAPDEPVDDELRRYVLGEKIKSVVSYRDSVAAVLTEDSNGLLLINLCWIEDGRWVNAGQDLAESEDGLYAKIEPLLQENLYNFPRIERLKMLPSSPEPFAHYLSTVQTSPEDFLISKLRKHRLVINGEYHHRKNSWDMIRRLVARPDFSEVCGAVVLELPSWMQGQMDTIMEAPEFDAEGVLEILRNEQPFGWPESGEFGLIKDLHSINRPLPSQRKIKVILADYQVPYSLLGPGDDTDELEDRNTHMADVIENYLEVAADDTRSAIFFVGCAHVFGSDIPGFASSAAGQAPARTAGAQLKSRLGDSQVFTVFQHVLPGDNSGGHKSPIRGGVFDAAFYANGNRPVGFDLAASPFGEEPFDGIHEIKYLTDAGTYSDNYDGYIFLGPLSDDERDPTLTELYTPAFMDEIRRRVEVLELSHLVQRWFGCSPEELTPAHFID